MAYVFLVFSLFWLGLVLICQPTLWKQEASQPVDVCEINAGKNRVKCSLAEQRLGYSCRLEGVMAFLAALFMFWSGRIAEPLVLVWGIYIVLEVVVLCYMVMSGTGYKNAPATPHPLMVCGVIAVWLALLLFVLGLEFQDFLNPDKPPVMEPFIALLTWLVAIWMIPRGVIRIGAGVTRNGKLQRASLISGALLVCVGVLVRIFPVIPKGVPREDALVVGVLIAVWGLTVASLGLQLGERGAMNMGVFSRGSLADASHD